jgi:electron transfer flavoprotein beta subunit
MHIVVCVKQTFDTEATISLTNQGEIDSMGISFILNPYDEFAVEEGIRLKEKWGGEVTVVTFGEERAKTALYAALAVGADEAILISDPVLQKVDEWVTAEVLAKAIKTIPYDVILAGRMAIDDGSAQVAVRLAEKLGIPSVNSVIKLQINGEKVLARREIDGGTEVVELSLPAVITAQKGLNEPRYASIIGITKAKKKPLKLLTLGELGLNPSELIPKTYHVRYSIPKPRQEVQIISGDALEASHTLVKLLREEAKVI